MMICRITTILFLLLSQVDAFSVVGSQTTLRSLQSTKAITSTTLYSTEAGQKTVPIILNGQNIDLTPALEEYVNKRIGGTLQKLANTGSVRECDVVLSVTKNPKVKDGHRVEVVTNLKGTTIICKNESPDMYTSIDGAAAALNRKLRKYKERRTAGWHGGTNMGEELSTALESLEVMDADDEDDVSDVMSFEDPGQPEITKVNSFQLDKPVSLNEAIFALDYVDHDFYVFTNEATGKINVVYKRHTGGVGLVEP